MDERTVMNVGAAALIAALLVALYVIRWLRLRETKRRMGEYQTRGGPAHLGIEPLARCVVAGLRRGCGRLAAVELVEKLEVISDRLDVAARERFRRKPQRETLRLCRGGSSSLRFPAVHRRSSKREQRLTRKELQWTTTKTKSRSGPGI